jgi:hypothetical protein
MCTAVYGAPDQMYQPLTRSEQHNLAAGIVRQSFFSERDITPKRWIFGRLDVSWPN